MKRLLRAAEVLAWAAFFAFALLALGLRFWVLPNIERFRDDIVSVVSRTVGQPVKIGAIEARWLGLNPQITFLDVRLYDAGGREALVLPAVENVVSWRSLAHGALRLHSLAIDRPQLDVRRDAAGTLYIAGMKLSGATGNGRLADWILNQDEILVRNAQITWHDEKRNAPPLALEGLDLRLRNSGDAHSIGFAARPPAELGSSVELKAELAGRTWMEPEAWSGRVYLELGATDLAGWRRWVDYPVDLQQGQGALRLWATLEKGQATQATADVELAHVLARLGKDLPPLSLAAVRGRLHMQEREGGYEFSGRKLALTAERGPSMSPADFRVAWQPAGPSGAEQGSLTASVLEFEPIAHIAEALPFPADLRRILADLAPRGRVEDARLEWTGPPSSPAKFHARGKFSDLSMRARENLPGFAGLSGSLDATEAKGSVQLASRKAELDLPRWLATPRVPLASLSGHIDWERKDGRTTVNLGSLNFANEHFEGKASGNYVHAGEGPGTIDLTVQLPRGDGRYVPRYLPVARSLNQETLNWIHTSILGGQASDVRLRLKGDLRDFPFRDPAKGQFQVTARVEKGVLEYAKGWPRITDVDAQLHFERDRMEVVGRSATVLGARLSGVRAHIAPLGPGSHLVVTGQADGPTSEFLKFIAESPVRTMTAGVSEAMSAQGRGKLRLRLDLPFGDLHHTKVDGDYDLASNTVVVHPQLPPLERATGKVSFTESSFTVHDVRARVFGGPVVLGGGSRPGLGAEVVAKGDATVAGLQPLFNHPWRRYLGGTTPYVASVSVRDGRTRVSLESSLRGLTSALPPPFAKSAADVLPVRVEVLPAEAGTRDRISVWVGRLAAAEVLRRRQGEQMVVQRAAVWFSPTADQPVRVPERPGTLVYGSLPALDVDRWMALFSEGGDSGAGNVALDLKFGTLDAYGKRLHDMAVRAGSDAAGWSATVQAKEIAGDVSYRSEKGGQLIARLKHFSMPDEYPGAKPRNASETRELPSVDLAAERFSYRGKQFGRVELVAQRAADAWRIDKITMVNPESSLTGRGQWQVAPASQTSLSFDIESSDAGQFLGRVGYPDLVRGGKAKLQAQLSWAGDPTTPDYPSMSGALQMQAENGQFLEIEPGIGKLVSLMSLQALPRRLTLDFRDVFSKGFQFDRISANAQIERGVMALKEFKMRGSAAEVDMTGEVDLAKETQNLQVRVVPSLGDSASTVIGLLNPLLIFPAAIAQRILKDPLGHIFAFDYSITGTWTDPKVARTRVDAKTVQEPNAP